MEIEVMVWPRGDMNKVFGSESNLYDKGVHASD